MMWCMKGKSSELLSRPLCAHFMWSYHVWMYGCHRYARYFVPKEDECQNLGCRAVLFAFIEQNDSLEVRPHVSQSSAFLLETSAYSWNYFIPQLLLLFTNTVRLALWYMPKAFLLTMRGNCDDEECAQAHMPTYNKPTSIISGPSILYKCLFIFMRQLYYQS